MFFKIMYNNGERKQIEADSINKMDLEVFVILGKKVLPEDDDPDQLGISHVVIGDFIELKNQKEALAFFNGIRYFKNELFNL